jgi:Zn-dependent peptidase ImmA (M78 family)
MVSARSDHGQGLAAAIAVEARDAAVRQAFTCAHELGHYVERSERGGDPTQPFAFVDRRTSASDIHEFYANEFAGNLLMPQEEVRRQIEENRLSAIELAGYFGVSLPAMSVRLRRLNLDQRVDS